MKNKWMIVILLGFTPLSLADVTLPKVIDSKMVLQRDKEVPIWGWADQGEEVTVQFAGQIKKAMPDASGKWIVKLDPLAASAESRSMTIKGKNEIKLEDVLVGEVWLASGQSNMKLTFGEGLGFAIPVEQVKFFLKHRDAFAYDNDNPSNAYRYLEPPHLMKADRASASESSKAVGR